MLKRFSAFLLILLPAAYLHAQDLPPLPGEAGQPALADQAALAGPDTTLDPKAQKAAEKAAKKAAQEKAKELQKLNKKRKKEGMEPLAALPVEGSAESVAAAPIQDSTQPMTAKEKKEADKLAKKKAKELEALNKKRKKQGLPALTSLPGEEKAATTSALPALPGETGATAEPGSLPALPGEAAAATAEPAGNSPVAHKARAKMKIWHAPDFGPNVIFGGIVRTPGGTVEEQLAWVSQHVLNGMDFNGFDFLHENGVYPGEGDAKQWREFTFRARKNAKAPIVTLYVEPSGKQSVFLRMGPSEPPAGVSASQVRRLRLENEKVLKIMRAQLKGRIRPARGRTWESPYHRTNG